MMDNEKKNSRSSEISKIRRKRKPVPQKRRRKRTAVKKRETEQQKKLRLWKQRVKKAAEIMETVIFLLFVCLCLYFMINFRSHEVDGQSMLPTFQDGDRLLTHKGQDIQRYDIVTFEPTDEPGSSYVKRVYGLPGDTIYVKENRLYLFRNGLSQADIAKQIEAGQLPDSTTVVALSEESQAALENKVEIPEKQYFVLGDNRGNSKDSRSIGLINQEQIEGVVNFRFYPFDRFGFVH
ncbi:signal peptidase I [Enterococcus sp. LJL51]|uniref:signal peptidase I n=1 Tax=Enterococcus sp. LJL51 TaxID=3416656 RepID=UPI003CF21C38